MRKGALWFMITLVTLLPTGLLRARTSTSVPRTPAPARTVAASSTKYGINRAWCAQLRAARATIRASQPSPTEPTSSDRGKPKTLLGIIVLALGVGIAATAWWIRIKLGRELHDTENCPVCQGDVTSGDVK